MKNRKCKLCIIAVIILLLTACANESAPVNSGIEAGNSTRGSDNNVGTVEKENDEQDYSDEVEEPYTGNALWNSSLFETFVVFIMALLGTYIIHMYITMILLL